MAYLKDIRENSIGINGELWEGDNRIEERHYWNGAYIDLCNLPAEEYTKTIFVTNGSGSSNEEVTPALKTKAITLEIVDNDAVITYSGELTSDMYVSITYNGGEEYTMMIEKGTAGGSGISFSLFDVESIDKFGIGLSEADALKGKATFQDEEFKYQIKYEAPIVYPMAYQLALMKGEIDTLSNDEIIAKLQGVEKLPMESDKQSSVFVAEIKSVPVEGLGEMSPIELTDVLIANAQDIILITDKEISDIVAVSTSDSVFDGWTKRDNKLTIEGVEYTIWYKRATSTELTSVYDPADSSIAIDVEQDSITYIIYYK